MEGSIYTLRIEKVTPYTTEEGESHGSILARNIADQTRVKIITKTAPKVKAGETYLFTGSLSEELVETRTENGIEVPVKYADGNIMKTRRVQFASKAIEKIGISSAETGF